MKKHAAIFFVALRFFTRLPVPAWVGHDPEQLEKAARYLPAVGMLVGAIGAVVTMAALEVLPSSLAILLGMAATLLATGAFHEDGLADAADGFGGGWDKAQVLAIMKDSRIGTFGVVALVLVLLAKFNALQALPWELIGPALVAGHAASRLVAVGLMQFMSYARDDESSRARLLTEDKERRGFFVAMAWGLAPLALLAFLAPLLNVALALVLAIVVGFLARRYFLRRLGGYTGDCLGAVQQLAELAIYIGLACSFS